MFYSTYIPKMQQLKLSELTDQELLDEAKKMKSASIIDATLIGCMIGVIIFSILKNTVGLFTLIPLFFAFKVFHKPKDIEYRKDLEKHLVDRNLK